MTDLEQLSYKLTWIGAAPEGGRLKLMDTICSDLHDLFGNFINGKYIYFIQSNKIVGDVHRILSFLPDHETKSIVKNFFQAYLKENESNMLSANFRNFLQILSCLGKDQSHFFYVPIDDYLDILEKCEVGRERSGSDSIKWLYNVILYMGNENNYFNIVYSGQEKKKVYEKITSILSSRNDKFKLDMEEKYNYENFKYYFRQLNLPAIDGGYERSHELKNLPKEMKKLIVKIWKKVHEEVLDDDNDDNDYGIGGGRF